MYYHIVLSSHLHIFTSKCKVSIFLVNFTYWTSLSGGRIFGILTQNLAFDPKIGIWLREYGRESGLESGRKSGQESGWKSGRGQNQKILFLF